MTILAVFRSRNQSIDFAKRLVKYGISANVTLAPKEARIGCGLCVKFDSADYIRVKAVLSISKYSAFKGFYRIDYSNGSPEVVPYAE